MARVLVVGTGVVGQVYGFHLAQAGAEVSFLVKAEHAAAARRGFTLFPLNRSESERTEPVRWAGVEVLTEMAEVARQRWDQVYLTMSSTGLRSGDWFARLVPAVGAATVVMLQPGPEDRPFVLRSLPEEQLVQGTITVIGYVAPLPGETRFPEPGVAYWFPPLSPCPLSGPAARREQVLETLRRGRLPATKADDVDREAAFTTALFMPLLAVLEEGGWSLRELRRRDRLRRARDAGREAVAALARQRGQRPPLFLKLGMQLPVLQAVAMLAPRVMPFDLQTYLRVHFTKVNDQTRDFLRYYRSLARSHGVPDRGLTSLQAT